LRWSNDRRRRNPSPVLQQQPFGLKTGGDITGEVIVEKSPFHK
jgi:hypothetical protein